MNVKGGRRQSPFVNRNDFGFGAAVFISLDPASWQEYGYFRLAYKHKHMRYSHLQMWKRLMPSLVVLCTQVLVSLGGTGSYG